ncbi:MAG: tannase/feruloyl esterase family alpha/beta hydrolase [Terracidiphilus sp.]
MNTAVLRSTLFSCSLTLSLLGIVLPAPLCLAQLPDQPAADPLPLVHPVLQCSQLKQLDISAAVGAKTHITVAAPIADGQPAPYCHVTGYVEPMVHFELRLPLATWTQRYVQTGCGGLCGTLEIRLGNAQGCIPADRGELALASTDMGHSGAMDGSFGDDNRLRIDFAYRGVHVTALAAKAIIAAFYGQQPRYSYFTGCSDGGREALMEAQRFPTDFNGITAGAPAMNFTTQNTFYHGWNALRNTDATGKPILTADKLPILHRAALQACDAADGLQDDLISNPIACRFDPGVTACKPGQSPDQCLTPAQVQAARDIYAGAQDTSGKKLVLSGPLPGSELGWTGVFVPFPGDDRIMSSMVATGSLKHLVYLKNPPDDYTLRNLKFTRASFTVTTQLHGLYDATDPYLGPFARSGGKLILWHGLADPHISPLNTIAYYTAMSQLMGEAEVQKFARLYLFPGGSHCGGGEGPFQFDLLSVLIAWVEQGSAPREIVASQQQPQPAGPIAGVPAEAPTGLPHVGSHQPPPIPDRTRPVYPYPLTAKYAGTGSLNDARNFVAGPADPVPAEKLRWLGSSFYTPHYQLWCEADATGPMTCKPGE